MRKVLLRIVATLIVLLVVVGLASMTVNNHVVNKEKDKILLQVENKKGEIDKEDLEKLKDVHPEAIIVLGAGIINRDQPTPMLKDRLDVGIELYKNGIAPKILLTGDNGQVDHNEIHTMLNYCLSNGVKKEDIFCDHAGFSTYDSIYRAKDIFQLTDAVIVTQTYHLYRAMYIGDQLGIKVYGVGSDQKKYSGQYIRELREVAARVKDFYQCKVGAKAQMGGERYDITGDGSITQGE